MPETALGSPSQNYPGADRRAGLCTTPDLPGGPFLPVRYAIGISHHGRGARRRRPAASSSLYRLAAAGRPDPDRFKHLSVDAELTEVGAQRKLFKRTIPGIAHAFVFWGFTILLFTILEAYGDLFDKTLLRPGHRPGPGARFHRGLLRRRGSRLVCSSSPSSGSSKSPARRQRRSRFYGSHTRAAWGVLAMIAWSCSP